MPIIKNKKLCLWWNTYWRNFKTHRCISASGTKLNSIWWRKYKKKRKLKQTACMMLNTSDVWILDMISKQYNLAKEIPNSYNWSTGQWIDSSIKLPREEKINLVLKSVQKKMKTNRDVSKIAVKSINITTQKVYKGKGQKGHLTNNLCFWQPY